MKGKQRPETQRGGQAKRALAAEILAGLGEEGGVGREAGAEATEQTIDRP
jgi:hypothetical protein